MSSADFGASKGTERLVHLRDRTLFGLPLLPSVLPHSCCNLRPVMSSLVVFPRSMKVNCRFRSVHEHATADIIHRDTETMSEVVLEHEAGTRAILALDGEDSRAANVRLRGSRSGPLERQYSWSCERNEGVSYREGRGGVERTRERTKNVKLGW